MKLLLYVGLLTAVWLIPVKGTDVGKLIPVEVIAVSEAEGIYTVRTDTGDLGMGQSLAKAFEDLEDTAPGEIYLDTAEYLLVEDREELHLAAEYLKSGVRVCKAEAGITLEGIADFLSAQKPGVRLNATKKLVEIPEIIEENGRYRVK